MTRSSRFMDLLSFAFSLSVVLIAAIWLWQSGILTVSLAQQENIIWYFIRSAGVTAYILLTISVVWGLALSSRVVKDWSPGALSMLLHSTVSWLGLTFALMHALLLLFDRYLSYQIADVLIPFTGPYRPLAVGLGTLAFWIMVVVTPSFALKKRLLGHRAWKLLHYASYAAFALVTIHGLAAGTDSGHTGFRLLIGISVLMSVILLGYRLGARRQTGSKRASPGHARARRGHSATSRTAAQQRETRTASGSTASVRQG